MEKRTSRLDKEREIDLGFTGANGVPVYTTKGDMQLSDAQKEELHAKLAGKELEGQLFKAMGILMENDTLFASHVFTKIAPPSVVDAQFHLEDEDQDKLFTDWVVAHRFQVIQEGLKTFVKCDGNIIAEMEAALKDFTPGFREVLSQRLAKGFPPLTLHQP